MNSTVHKFHLKQHLAAEKKNYFMLLAHAVSFPECEPACSSAELKEALPHHKSKSYGPSLRKKISWRTLVLITHQVTSSSEQIITQHSLISYPWQCPTLEVSKKIVRLLGFLLENKLFSAVL